MATKSGSKMLHHGYNTYLDTDVCAKNKSAVLMLQCVPFRFSVLTWEAS